jgi:hypothetical protein
MRLRDKGVGVDLLVLGHPFLRVMQKTIQLKCTLLTLLLLLSFAPLQAALNPAEQRLAQFIAGAQLLMRTEFKADTARAHALVELEQLCGISLEQAKRTVERYRNQPQAWQKILEQAKVLLEELNTNSH